MDGNLAVFIVMIVLVLGGGILLNFQIKHSETKERGNSEERSVKASSSGAFSAFVRQTRKR